MSTHYFALIEVQLNGVAASTTGVLGLYSDSLRAALSRYWQDVSGYRVEVQWDDDRTVLEPVDWLTLEPKERLMKVRDDADPVLSDGVNVLVLSNVPNEPFGGRHFPGTGILLRASGLTPASAAHEMGHYFQFAHSATGGHADVLRSFYRDEYADRTCIMGSDAEIGRRKYTFIDGSMPPPLTMTGGRLLQILQHSGPAMCPAQADFCGWVTVGEPGVAQIDGRVLGSTILGTWRGAPPLLGFTGSATVATLDGWAPDGGRLYASVREKAGWDKGFGSWEREWRSKVYLHMSLPDGDSVLLGECRAQAGQSITAGAAPIEVQVRHISAEGVEVVIAQQPWRGWSVVEGVRCAAFGRIAACTDGTAIDAFVIDQYGTVRRNRYDGSGWEAGPWPALLGVLADPGAGIATVRTGDGTIRAFVVALDGHVYERSTKPDWNGLWRALPGITLDPTSSVAAALVDDSGVVLSASVPDGMVLRCYLDGDTPVTNWHTAPNHPRQKLASLAAVPNDTTRGHTFAVAADEGNDFSIWAWPGVDDHDERYWEGIRTDPCDPRSSLAAVNMQAGSHVVVVGEKPMMCLVRRGAWDWQPEWPTDLDRELTGGIAAVSRRDECIDLLAIDRDGSVNVTSRSPHVDYTVPFNQFSLRRVVALVAANGNWVTAKSGGGEGMGADASTRRKWELFTMHGLGTYRGDGRTTLEVVALQAHGGQYLSATGGGGTHVFATATSIGPWEKFTLGTSDVGPGYETLRCIDEIHYLVADGGGGHALGASAKEGPATQPTGGAVFRLEVF